MKKIKNGDVYDIGQTINGVSTFLWCNDTIFYFTERMSHRDSVYEYDRDDLTRLVEQDIDEETTYVGNILETFKPIER